MTFKYMKRAQLSMRADFFESKTFLGKGFSFFKYDFHKD